MTLSYYLSFVFIINNFFNTVADISFVMKIMHKNTLTQNWRNENIKLWIFLMRKLAARYITSAFFNVAEFTIDRCESYTWCTGDWRSSGRWTFVVDRTLSTGGVTSQSVIPGRTSCWCISEKIKNHIILELICLF